MNLTQLRQLAAQSGCSPAEWSPLSVQSQTTPDGPRAVHPMPASDLLGPPVPAYYNHGRWLVDCECGSAQVTDPEDRRVFCPFCGNGGLGLWRPVTWPKGWKAIEAGLAGHPVAQQNWHPDEPKMAAPYPGPAFDLSAQETPADPEPKAGPPSWRDDLPWPLTLTDVEELTAGDFLSQWHARTADDRPVYISVRGGVITMCVGEPGQSHDEHALDVDALTVEWDEDTPRQIPWAEVVDRIRQAGDFLADTPDPPAPA